MITHNVNGQRWYMVAVHYPDAVRAKLAWERAERRLMPGPDTGVGITRMKPNPGNVPSGSPKDVHPVVAVTTNESTATAAELILKDGTPWEPTTDFCEWLIHRRIQIVAANEGRGLGRVTIRRPDDKGAFMDADTPGRLVEQ